MPRRLLVVGGGGREHALAWKLAGEPGVEAIIVAPGSAGIADGPRTTVAAVSIDSIATIVDLAGSRGIDLVVVGPEAPLAAGLVDALVDAGIPAFGPTRAAATIESSKAFCHDVAAAAGVPMARSAVCGSRLDALRAVEEIGAGGTGVVIKEDGLAAGKGVAVLDPDEAADPVVSELFERHPAGIRLVVEERLYGPEASVIAVCDGQRAVALPPARDHKRLEDGDRGPNTGGMGAYAPLADLVDSDVDRIVSTVHLPILAELDRRGTPFRGFLYAGLMLTAGGPVLLECNARLGDPEAQVILPLLDGDLGPVLLEAASGALRDERGTRFPALPLAAVGIVLAGGDYPARASRGVPIDGIADARELGALVFHAGTSRTATGWATDGGRILTVVGRGHDVAAARSVAEEAADLIRFDGLRRRHDIASTVFESLVS
jgi:phosphoribosylamine---glycine ligase